MAAEKKCCVVNCGKTRADNTILHAFPNPENDSARFDKWLAAVGDAVSHLDRMYIHKYRKVCHEHFERRFWMASKRLSAIAYPTLYLSGDFGHSGNENIPPIELASSSTSTGLFVSYPLSDITNHQRERLDHVMPSTSAGAPHSNYKHEKTICPVRLHDGKPLISKGDNSNPYNPSMSATPSPERPTSIKKKKEQKQKIVTGYILYSSEIRKTIVANNPDCTFGEISRIVGNEWRSLPPSTKESWKERATRCNEETSAKLAEEMKELTEEKFGTVQQKLKTYKDVEELTADIELLVSNAIAVYKPGSLEYKDAIELWKLYMQTKIALESDRKRRQQDKEEYEKQPQIPRIATYKDLPDSYDVCQKDDVKEETSEKELSVRNISTQTVNNDHVESSNIIEANEHFGMFIAILLEVYAMYLQ